jgi:hypothetical protein
LETNEEYAARLERQNKEREDELRRVPHQTVDKSKWPRTVRSISTSEGDGLGIDVDGRLYWNGKPVEIIGRRLDLTKRQAAVALAVMVFTAFAAFGTLVQAGVAYQDWACKSARPAILSCARNSPAGRLVELELGLKAKGK